jgi:hypothetical protein
MGDSAMKQIEIFMIIQAEDDCTDQAINRLRQAGDILNISVRDAGHEATENAFAKAFMLTTEDRKELS